MSNKGLKSAYDRINKLRARATEECKDSEYHEGLSTAYFVAMEIIEEEISKGCENESGRS